VVDDAGAAAPTPRKVNLAAIATVMVFVSCMCLGVAAHSIRATPMHINVVVVTSMVVDGTGILIAGAGLIFRIEKRPRLAFAVIVAARGAAGRSVVKAPDMAAAIPLSHPDITQREIDAVVEVLQTPTLSIGPKVVEFEKKVAAVTGRRHGVAVCSGTCGLHVVMMSAGIKPGDEVITTPFSFVASANCILFVGATPVFVDIDNKTLNMDVTKVTAAITPKTRAIVGVEAFGHPGGMVELEQLAQANELILIEDSCEGFGGSVGSGTAVRQIGSFGRASVFGFYPNKQITTGEGGMIVTDDDNFAEMCRSLRNQGRAGMGWLAHQRMGFNYRLSEMNAALGCVQVDRLEEILDRRRIVAEMYMHRLMDNRFLIVPTLQHDTHMSWFVFVVRLNDQFEPGDRDLLMADLKADGIGCQSYFPPIHLQPYMAEQFGFSAGDFPVCEYVSARTLALPFFGAMTAAQVDRVCSTLDRLLEKRIVSRKNRL
jgi:perosamine synthetase